jgi:hypothetical protein
MQLVSFLDASVVPWAARMWAAAVPAGHHPHLCSHARKLLASVPPDIAQALCTSHPARHVAQQRHSRAARVGAARGPAEAAPRSGQRSLSRLPAAVTVGPMPCAQPGAPPHGAQAVRCATRRSQHPCRVRVPLTCAGARQPVKRDPEWSGDEDDAENCWAAGYVDGQSDAARDEVLIAVRPSACALPRASVSVLSLDATWIECQSRAPWHELRILVHAAGTDLQDLRCDTGMLPDSRASSPCNSHRAMQTLLSVLLAGYRR